MTRDEAARRREQGRRIRMSRVGAGLNQTDLAEKVSAETGDDISRTIIGGIESGRRDAEYGILLAIANICGVSRDWLTGDQAIPGSNDPWGGLALSDAGEQGYLNLHEGELLTAAGF